LLAATVRSFAHMPLRISDRNNPKAVELFQGTDQGSPTSLKLRATYCVPINAKDFYIDTHIWNLNFAQFTFNYFSIDIR